MKNFELIAQKLSEETKHKLRCFLQVCLELNQLIERENQLLLANGTIVFDGFCARKLKLLDNFDVEVKAIFELMKTQAPSNHALQAGIIADIQDLKRRLDVNSSFHLNDLKKRAARIIALREGVIAKTFEPPAEDQSCH